LRTVLKLYAFFHWSIIAFYQFRPLGGVQYGRQFDHGFLLVFNTHFLSSKHQSKVTRVFSIVHDGGMSILATRERSRQEMTSSVDRTIMVFSSCSTDTFRLASTLSTLLALFQWLQTAEFLFRSLRGRSGREMTSPFNPLTPILYRSTVESFHLYLTVQKLFDFFVLPGFCHRGLKVWRHFGNNCPKRLFRHLESLLEPPFTRPCRLSHHAR
jgi:hypothetical protein